MNKNPIKSVFVATLSSLIHKISLLATRIALVLSKHTSRVRGRVEAGLWVGTGYRDDHWIDITRSSTSQVACLPQPWMGHDEALNYKSHERLPQCSNNSLLNTTVWISCFRMNQRWVWKQNGSRIKGNVFVITQTTLNDGSNVYILKTLDTIGNCQRIFFTVGVSQHMHKITNMWKFELNRSSNLRDNNERKNTLVTRSCVLSDVIEEFAVTPCNNNL